MRVAAVQMRSTADPARNAADAAILCRRAAAAGATYVQTPEVTNLVQRDRKAAAPLITTEEHDPTLAALRRVAAETGIAIHIGSLVLREGDTLRNRAVLIGPDGAIRARYDKMHMFDVDLPNGERIRESAAFTAGDAAVLTDVGSMRLGITICFDLRFPAAYQALAAAGATVLTAPSAFSEVTGRAHWHVLIRARAIENGAFVIAAAQDGAHEDGRTTYGHSLIVDPWGRVLAEASDTPSVIRADLDLSEVERVRGQIPVLSARREVPVRTVREAVTVAR